MSVQRYSVQYKEYNLIGVTTLEGEVLGHTISAAGAAPTADQAAKIKLCPPPRDIKQLQCFLGMVNFYPRFLPNCAQVLRPLTNLLKGGAKTLELIASAQEAFQNAIHLLAAAVPLQHPAPNAKLSLATDASDTHIGGVINKNLDIIGSPWFILPQVNRHRIPLLNI